MCVRTLYALVLMLLTVSLLQGAAFGAGDEATTGGSYQAWLQHRASVLRDPAILRYYTFETAGDPAVPVPNLAGDEGALSFSLVPKEGAPTQELAVIEGPWPGKKAVRLDQGVFSADAFEVTDRSFTVQAWFRKNGPGTHRGNAEATNGTILSVGIGYWDGWRLTTSYPSLVTGFEIGRPQPSSSVGISTGPVSDAVWHHLAATWDGKEMRVYVDGLLAAAGEYAGEYTSPPTDKRFRVGYADYGWGSVLLDVDEVAVYRRALSPERILRDAHFYAPLPYAAASRLTAASEALVRRDYRAAADAYAAVLKTNGLHPDYLSAARLGLAQAERGLGRLPQAAAELSKVLETPGVADRYQGGAVVGLLQLLREGAGSAVPRRVHEKVLTMPAVTWQDRLSARIQIARSLRDEKDFAAAREQYAKALEMPELPLRDRLGLALEQGDTCREGKQYAAARREYAAVVDAAGAPAVYRSLAQLRLAATYIQERKYDESAAQYRKLQAMADVPDHHKWEAGERLRELERLKAGLPARDPAWSRVHLPKRPAPAVTLNVSPRGDDRNPGTEARPFATLDGARDTIRALKQKQGVLPVGGVEVVVHGGEYRVDGSFRLTQEDSGTAEAPVVYRAAKDETPRFIGSIRLDGFKLVTDAAVLSRLAEKARGKVYQCDLRALGLDDLGVACGATNRADLYFDGKPLTLARWPNVGFLRVGELRGEQTFDVWGSIRGNRDGKFTYDHDRAGRWQDEQDIWLYGYWFWDWADSYEKVASIDIDNRTITTAPPYHSYGFRSGQRYFVLNLLSEIDIPGEWYLDRSRGILYLWPPSDPAKAAIELSALPTPLVQTDDTSYVTFERLTFEGGRSNGVVIKGGNDCLLAGCTICRLGENGVVVDGGTAHGILGCDIFTLGRGGTAITGGDRKTLTPGRHFIENCHVHDFSHIYRTYTPAVLMNGCGNRITHNLFNDSPHHAMRIEGNDHVIEFNDIHSVVYEADDQGGLDMWHNVSYRGTIVRYNYWHHIGSGFGGGQAGVRLDDAISGVLIYGNIFYRCSNQGFGGVQIHGGKENILDNNLFVDCKYAVSFSPWGEQRWQEYLASADVRRKLYEEVDITKPPYSTRYPTLARVAENADVNMLWRNLAYACGAFTARDRGVNELVDNYITAADPGILVRPGQVLRLRDDSPAYARLGLRPIPFDEIGLYQDEYRATWPVDNRVSEHYQASEERR